MRESGKETSIVWIDYVEESKRSEVWAQFDKFREVLVPDLWRIGSFVVVRVSKGEALQQLELFWSMSKSIVAWGSREAYVESFEWESRE